MLARSHAAPGPYRDRAQAGRILADELRDGSSVADAVVLALPRGGVPVGYEIAKALGLRLDLMLVRKLGVPWQPELAMGALAEGGILVLAPDVVQETGLSEQEIAEVAAVEQEELERRAGAYRGDRQPPDVSDRTVVLVDDGVATGSTMRAAMRAVRDRGAARVVLAVPVAAPEVIGDLTREADEVICPVQPSRLWAIGQWYERFDQLTDSQVRELLARAADEPEEARDEPPTQQGERHVGR